MKYGSLTIDQAGEPVNMLGGMDAVEALLSGKKKVVLAESTWRSLLNACKQELVNGEFTEEHYPLEPVADDENEWEICEHHFNETVTEEEAFRRLPELGYRLLGGPRRAMEFVAKNPDLQMDHPLVVTARWRRPKGLWYAPVFYRDDGRRSLILDWLVVAFNPICGWLVLRKRY